MENLSPFIAVSALIKVIIDWLNKAIGDKVTFTWQPIASIILGVLMSYTLSVNIFAMFTDVLEPVKYWLTTFLTGLLLGAASNGVNNIAEALIGLKRNKI